MREMSENVEKARKAPQGEIHFDTRVKVSIEPTLTRLGE